MPFENFKLYPCDMKTNLFFNNSYILVTYIVNLCLQFSFEKVLHHNVVFSNDGPQTIRVDSIQLTEAYERTQTLELKGLDTGLQYDVWVTASTAVGEGPESRRVSNTPSQRGE